MINVVREETFGNKVATALNQRKQGQFDKAMLIVFVELSKENILKYQLWIKFPWLKIFI